MSNRSIINVMRSECFSPDGINNRFSYFLVKTVLVVFILASHLAAETEVSKINFHGTAKFTADRLMELIHSQVGDEFDPRLVKLDKILLTNFFRKQGYLTVTIDDSLVRDKKADRIEINYLIETGRRYFLSGFRFSGTSRNYEKAVRRITGNMQPNQPFDEGLINTKRQELEDFYYNTGKPFVEVSLDYEFQQDSLVIVKMDLKEGPTVYFRDVRFRGLKLVKKFILRRELEFKKGERFSRKKLDDSQRNIYGTGLFDYVRMEIVPLENDSVNVDVRILVQERDPRWIGLRIGFAYEQQESYGNKLELTAEGGHRNLFGTARSLSLHLIPSFLYDIDNSKIVNPENQLTLVYVEPWIGYTRTPGVFQAGYHQYRPLNSADFNVLSTSFRVSHKYQNRYELSGELEAKFVDLISQGKVDTTLDVDAGKDQVYSLSGLLRKDTRNNFFNPTDGSLVNYSVTFSNSFGETRQGERDIKQYFTFISSWQRYQPLFLRLLGKKRHFTLATRLKGGAIYELGETKSIPISDLFFAGGATTVRGYSEQLLGPGLLDANGKKTSGLGGKLLFLANAEIRFPLFWLIMGEIFVDAGNVWSELVDFRPTDIRFTTGVGLALLTPIGPIRLDYGHKLQREPADESAGTFHLGIYFAF